MLNSNNSIDIKTPSLIKSSFQEVGSFSYSGNTLFNVDGNGNSTKILTGKVAVTAQVKMEDNRFQLLLLMENGRNEQLTELVKSDSLTAQNVASLLRSFSLVVYSPTAVLKFINELTALVSEKPALLGITTVGWLQNRQAFFTGLKLIYPKSTNASIFHTQPVATNVLRMTQKGSLSDWQSHIGVHIEANDIPLVFTCLAFASVLLDRVNLSSSVFTLFGHKGKGKTLSLQTAASVWGNGCDPATGTPHNQPYIRKANSTVNGLEVLLSTYTPLPIILDELGELKHSDLAQLCYSLASGMGKTRMNSDLSMATSYQWLSNILMSSEFPISQLITSSGNKQVGGQADRAVDIPMPEAGLFDHFSNFDSFSTLTRHLKKVTSDYYGTAGNAFIQYCLNNDSKITKTLEGMAELEEALAPKNCDSGEQRIVKRFALSCLAGIIAIDAGILTCDSDRIIDAHEQAIKLWWNQRANGIITLANLLNSGNVRQVNQSPAHGQGNVVFRHKGLITFEHELFERLFPNQQSMLKELDNFGLIRREQPDRLKHRYCSNSFFGYSFLEEKLLPWLTPSDDQTTEQSLDDDFA